MRERLTHLLELYMAADTLHDDHIHVLHQIMQPREGLHICMMDPFMGTFVCCINLRTKGSFAHFQGAVCGHRYPSRRWS